MSPIVCAGVSGTARTTQRGPRRRLRLSRIAGCIAALVFVLLGVATTPSGVAAQLIEPPAPAPEIPLPESDRTALDDRLDDGLGNPINTDSGEDGDEDGSTDLVTVTVGDAGSSPSQSLILIVGLGVLSLAPSLVIMLSSFTRIVIVLSMTRNALGLQGVPPNQVITGLALFLSLFVMGPTLENINTDALQPYLDGQITQSEALDRAQGPIREFMLSQEPDDELAMILDARGAEQPATPDDIPLSSLIPAFLLHELKAAFIIGLVIFIPFVIIDLIVSAVLMSLGMMMLPPVFVSLPFKLILFVLVGGWSLIVQTLLESFQV